MPERLTSAKTPTITAAATNVGNGSVSSPARYEAAGAAETTELAVKSRRRSAAPTRAMDFRVTLILEDVRKVRANDGAHTDKNMVLH
jgi:hypothetical protein